MSSSANQPVCVGTSDSYASASDPHEPEPGRAEQVLDGAACDDVGAERCDVELDRPARLVAVRQHERAGRTRRVADRRDVVAVTGAVGERRAADERRPLVDRLDEPLGRDRPVRLRPHVDNLRATELLRVRDLPDRRELVLADHDPVARPVERERRDQRAHALRDGRRDRDVVRSCVQKPRDSRAKRLVPLDPEVPLRAVGVPAREPLLDRLAHGVRESALRARVEVRRGLEDRELAAYRGADGARLGLRR